MSFPAARRSWRCGDVWDKDRQDYVDSGKGCRQEIYRDIKEKFPSGKYKIKNLKDGRGGKAGEDHLCHNTGFHEYDHTWKAKYNKAQENLPCSLCGEKFNALKVPVCPNCYKQQCRKCGAKQQWITNERISLKKTTMKDNLNSWNVYLNPNLPDVSNECRTCGHDKLDVVETFYHRKKLDKNFKTAKEMMS